MFTLYSISNSDGALFGRKSLDALESDIAFTLSQKAFMERSSKFIQCEGRAVLVPSFPVRSSSARVVCLVGDCEACGEPLSADT